MYVKLRIVMHTIHQKRAIYPGRPRRNRRSADWTRCQVIVLLLELLRLLAFLGLFEFLGIRVMRTVRKIHSLTVLRENPVLPVVTPTLLGLFEFHGSRVMRTVRNIMDIWVI